MEVIKELIQSKSWRLPTDQKAWGLWVRDLLIVDDIHFIHASHPPTTSQTSTAWHIWSGLIDVHKSVLAVPRPSQIQKKLWVRDWLIVDDIHFIHASHPPTTSQTSTAWHMWSGLIDVHKSVLSVPRPSQIQKKNLCPSHCGCCEQKWCYPKVQRMNFCSSNPWTLFSGSHSQYFNSSYMATLSPEHRTLKMADAKLYH